jgi:competence protein ComEC
MEVLMLLIQLALLIIGILCPTEIRLAYFTHILIFCLYLLATKKYKYLIFIIILVFSLLISWQEQKLDINFNASQIFQIPLKDLKNNRQFGLVLTTNALEINKKGFNLHSWIKPQRLIVNLIFDERFKKVPETVSLNLQQSDDVVYVQVTSHLMADKEGSWLQRRMYRHGFDLSVDLNLIDWTLAQQERVNHIPVSLSQQIINKLDVLFISLESWSYTKALILGVTNDLSQKDYWLIKQLGLMHLFVVSGLHIGFIYLMVKALAASIWFVLPAFAIRFFADKALFTFALLLPVSLLYAFLTGWGESVQRAVLMLLLWRMFNFCGIKTSSYRVLLLSLYLILMMNSVSLTSPGLWLSFSLVFLLLVYFDSYKRYFANTIKLQIILTLCSAGLILGWQASISSVNIGVNLIVLPLTGLFWFPVAFIASFIAFVFGDNSIMVWLDSVIVFLISQLKLIAYSTSSLMLVSKVKVMYKVGLYIMCLAWVLYLHRLTAWLVFPLILAFFVFTEPFNYLEKMGTGLPSVVLSNNKGDVYIRSQHNEPSVSSKWVNNHSELSMMWLAPYLFPAPSNQGDALKVLVWPVGESLITPERLKVLSPNWLVLKRSPNERVINLLQAMQVSWVVMKEGERMKFEFWSARWLVKHSN